ncbi:hypothetical protein ACJA25_03470 [Mycoplasmopsis hyopharyngis]|uniref:hypothetical protein n=1 Tax=Mycoplasmopsis hyopharyngis TaxID=29558 RepID=UPI003872D0BA
MRINSKFEAWNELLAILEENKINYSLSKYSLSFLKQTNIAFENNFQICLWWKDYLFLKKKFPALFIDNSIDKYQNSIPIFKFNNAKIIIQIIVGTSEEKISKLKLAKLFSNDLKVLENKKILKWKFNSFIKKHNINEIVANFNQEEYNFFISIGETINHCYLSKNLLWGDVSEIEYNGMRFKVFNDYLK